MKDYKITTAQNVVITQNLAGVWQRILAVLFDTLFLTIFYYLIFWFISFIHFDKQLSAWSFIAVLTLPYFLYYPLLQYWMNGQTIGKLLMHIRIVKTDNSHPKLGDLLIRWVMRLFEINLIPGLGLIILLFSDKNQRLGDIVAKTIVVQDTPKINLNHTIFEDLAQDYQPFFTEVVKLKPQDIQMIKTVLTEAKKHPNKRQLIKNLSQKIQTLLQINKPANISNEAFVNTILKDYNYFAGKL
jgi:uncharacterized RDD family membrane protein YckC